MSAVIPTIDVIPITTPRIVSAERILLVRTVSSAIATTSVSRPTRMIIARGVSSPQRARSFPSERLDRIEPRGPHRRIQTEEETDERRDADAEGDRPDFDRRRDGREPGDRQGDRD